MKSIVSIAVGTRGAEGAAATPAAGLGLKGIFLVLLDQTQDT